MPITLGINLDAWTALVIGLSVYSSCFIAEAYRAGIQAVPKGHREAAQVLGMTTSQAFVRIVLPQAVRMTLPPLAANFVQLIKYSSLGAVISVGEITRRGMELSASIFRPLEVFTFIAIVYFLICAGTDRRTLRHRGRHHRQAPRHPPRRASARKPSSGRGLPPVVRAPTDPDPRQGRSRQGHALRAHPLAQLHPVPRRRARGHRQ
jgi:ABC-type Fe3+ transport system permease subunit